MRTLFYVPIIHTSADMGSLAKAIEERGIAGFGKEFWAEHESTVLGFWDTVVKYFAGVDVADFRIYQDGMIVDDAAGQHIVDEGFKAGSRNYELVAMLLKRGAMLVKTEDLNLVKAERDNLLKITNAKSLPSKLLAYVKYRLTKNMLLKKRDEYIVRQIEKTLPADGTGILFIGAYHNARAMFSGEMKIIEVKDIGKVREYQELLPFHAKNKKYFAELADYLLSEIRCTK